MARQVKRTEKRDDIFFTTFASSGSVLMAAKAAGYSKSAVYRYLEDEDFLERMKLAKYETFDLIRGSAVDLAVNGDRSFKVLNLINPSTGKKATKVVEERKRSASMIQYLVERMGASEFDKEIIKSKLQKTELENEEIENWTDDQTNQFFADVANYLDEFQLSAFSNEEIENRILLLQGELEKRNRENNGTSEQNEQSQ